MSRRPKNLRTSSTRLSSTTDNLPAMPGVFPDYPAPVVRNAGAEREMVLMRCGMPPPPKFGGPPVTNIRNTSSPHWRSWLKPENRCLVPFNSFAEYAPERRPTKSETYGSALHGMRRRRCNGRCRTTCCRSLGAAQTKKIAQPRETYSAGT
jgi:putative SOS response-associated peptidase YedK